MAVQLAKLYIIPVHLWLMYIWQAFGWQLGSCMCNSSMIYEAGDVHTGTVTLYYMFV